MSLHTYQFGILDVRVVDIEGSPWIVAADIGIAIGYAIKPNSSVNTTHATRILTDDEIITHR